MKITRLRTLHMDNPLGVDVNPYFSWIMESNRQNVFQDSYRIVVTTESGETVWDTGQIKSDTSIYIPYEGKTLLSRETYKVSVWVKDNYGEETSAEGTFETGLLSAGDWKAQWVESPIRRKKAKKGFGKQEPATMFRKSFILQEKPVRARCYATCHGIYRMTVNGNRADNREFAPEHTVYEKYLCYQVYDRYNRTTLRRRKCIGNVCRRRVVSGRTFSARHKKDETRTCCPFSIGITL